MQATLRAFQSPNHVVLKATLLLTSTLTVMAGAMIAPSLPRMGEAFAEVDPDGFLVRLVLTLPALFIVIGAPVAGYIVDHFGRKQLLILTTILYGIAGSSGYIAPTLETILIGRAILGLAVAGLMTSVTTLITDYYEGKARAQFLGLQVAFMGLGGTLFLTIGGFLADSDWRNPFLIYLFSFVILPLIVLVLTEPAHEKNKPPPQKSKTNWVEKPKRQPLPITLLVFIYGSVMLIQVVFYLVPVQLPFYLQDLTGASATESGLAIAGMTLFFAIASSLFGWVDQRFDRMTVFIIGFGLTAIGYALVYLAQDWFLLLIGLPVAGFGQGLLMPNLSVWLTNIVPLEVRGRALSGITTAVFLGQFLSPILAQPIVDLAGVRVTYGLAGGVLLLMVIVIVASRNHLQQLDPTVAY